MPPLLIALSSGGVQYEWKSPIILGMLLFSLAMTGIFVAIETRAKSPIMPLSFYANPAVSLAVGIMFLASFGMYGSVLFLPLLFQVSFGYSAAQSGGLLIPMLLGMVVGGVLAGQVLSRTSGVYRIQTLVCAGLMNGGLFLLSTLDGTAGVESSQIYIVIAGLGTGGIVATLSIGVQNHVPFAVVGVATAALQFYRSVGGVIGLAVRGVLLATRFSSSLEEATPEAVKGAFARRQFQELQNDPKPPCGFRHGGQAKGGSDRVRPRRRGVGAGVGGLSRRRSTGCTRQRIPSCRHRGSVVSGSRHLLPRHDSFGART